MRILENYWDIVERAIRFQGCWFLIMLQMGHFMSTYIVVSKFLSVCVFKQMFQFLQHAILTAQMKKDANSHGHGV